MKKILNSFTALSFLGLICLSQSVKAQLSDAERQERCQNNKNRVAELEAQIRDIDTDLSASMGEKELEDTRTQLVYLKSLRLKNLTIDWHKLDRISALHNFKFQECYDSYKLTETNPFRACAAKLEKIVAAKIDKSLTIDRPALEANKKEANKQLASHRTNLIALGCDNQPEPHNTVCKLEGSWTQDTPGIGTTTWEIKSDGTANEKGIGYAEGKATLNGNILLIDWKTSTGYEGYYKWTLGENCSSVKGTLVFKTPRTDSLKSTVRKN